MDQRRPSQSSMSMDPSHGPTHGPAHGHGPSRSQSSFMPPPAEGEVFENAPVTTTQTIEIPPTNPHGVNSAVTTPGYDYQPSMPSPAPTKRSTESKPPSDEVYPIPKRIRVDETTAGIPTPSPSPPTSPTCTESSSAVRRCLERSSSHRDKPLGAIRLHRSKSLPAPLRPQKRRRPVDNQQHMPPVTLSTLRELDLHEIYRNPKLRHDVVFDSQLHFRPNLDGSRGRRKREQADIYWKWVLHECDMLFANVRNRQVGCGGLAIKLPILFSTMRDILLTLVPKGDRGDVEAALDPPLLMQQLEHGVLDFKKLAGWLAGVLKAHCAPMRDAWVDQMVARVYYGVDNDKSAALVDGLKMTFSILEAMKLDVANHQIRTLRPHLVSTAIHFEQGYFQERIESGRLDMNEPREWFRSVMANHVPSTDVSETFTRGVVELLTPTRNVKYPATFTFDVERMDGLRDDIREATCLKLSILFFRQLTLASRRDVDTATVDRVRAQIVAILGEEEGVARWTRGCSAVALHLAQAANEFNGHAGLADAAMIRIAENWLARHLQVGSPIYARVEQDVLKDVAAMVLQILKGWSSLSTFPTLQTADLTGLSMELASIAQRVSHIAFLHWRIFGALYLEA